MGQTPVIEFEWDARSRDVVAGQPALLAAQKDNPK